MLSIGNLATNGNSTISLSSLVNSILSSGTVNFTGSANALSVAGALAGSGTYTLVSGASLAGTSGLTLTGAAINGATLALGQSSTNGRSVYQFTSTASALQLVTTASVLDLTWDPTVSSGTWDTSATNWLESGTGSQVAYTDGDNVTFGSAATVTVPSAVAPGTMAITNTAGSLDLSGAGSIAATSLSKSGAGAATIAGNLTVAGGVTMSAGSLTTGGTLGVTAGGLNVSGGSLTANGAANVTAGGLNVSGGSAALNAGSTIAGGVSVTGGTAALNANNTVSGAVAVSGGGTLSGANPLTFTGAITGSGALTKTGAGEFTVSGTLGTSSRGMSVSVAAGSSLRLTGTTVKYLSGTVTPGALDGTLTFDNASLTLMGGTVAAGTGTIVLSGSSSITGLNGTGFATIAAPISGTGSLTIEASANNRTILTGSNPYSGGTFLNRNVGITNGSALGTGLITLIASSTNASKITNEAGTALTLANAVNTGATVLSLAGSNAIVLTGTISGGGSIRAAAGIADLTQQTALTMLNTGTVEMNNGQMWVNSSSNLGSNASILFSGTASTLVAKGDTGTIAQNVFFGASASSYASVDTGGYTMMLGGTLADLGSGAASGFVKTGAGTLILTASNTYIRDTLVPAGTLLVNGALYTGTAAGTTTVASGAVLGGSGLIAGAVNVDGTLKGNGPQFTGPVTILGGTHAPGNSPGSQTFLDDLTYSGSATLEWELITNGTAGAGTDFDFIAITGGTLTIVPGAAMQLVFSGSGSSVNWTTRSGTRATPGR